MNLLNQPRHPRAAIWLACGSIVFSLTLAWYLSPRQVELTSDTYDCTIALYRVCNQRDIQGLDQLQEKLDELAAKSDLNHSSMAHLQRIIDEAKSGDWESAMRHARNTLDDQTEKM